MTASLADERIKKRVMESQGRDRRDCGQVGRNVRRGLGSLGQTVQPSGEVRDGRADEDGKDKPQS